jgi:hypothetical protein
MRRKTEVYSWRVSPALKSSLEDAARNERRSVARLLDDIVAEHLRLGRTPGGSEALQQRRLHERAARFAGSIAGGQPGRAERARELVRRRLRRRARAR